MPTNLPLDVGAPSSLSAWAQWLTKPLDLEDEPIRRELIVPHRGHKNKTIFGAIYLDFIAGIYAWYAHIWTGLVLAILITATAIWRLRALENRRGDPYWNQNLAAGLAWAGLIGVTCALCIATRQLSLIALAGPVMAGLANGAALVNAGVPRLAKVQVVLMVFPYVLLSALSGDNRMFVIPLVFPFWIAGIFDAISDAHHARAMLIQAQKHSDHLAHHDTLTSLPNRAKFMEALALECCLTNKEADRSSYVLYLDLDGFKGVNDAFGHGCGDDLLCAVAARFQSVIRDIDMLGRLGGDEFATILRSVKREEALAIGTKFIEALREPFHLDRWPVVHIGVSIGGTRIDAPSDMRKTLEAADTMLYAAKRSGKGTLYIA